MKEGKRERGRTRRKEIQGCENIFIECAFFDKCVPVPVPPCSAGTSRKCSHNSAISNNVFKIIQNEKIEKLMDGGERRM